jgi:anti-sigma-K factor RskA
MRRRIADCADALAAEFALGTLRGRARQRFEALARSDAALGDARRRWESALTPLALDAPGVEPPARVWLAIEDRIGARANEASKRSASALWRALGLVAGGLATVLVAALLWLSPAREGEPGFVAMLNAPDAVPRMMVTMQAGELHVRPLKPWTNVAGRSLELWALPRQGAPRSLGLVSNDADTRIALDPGDARLRDATSLAVSLEPREGSPTGQPTGPVLCSGAIAVVKKA